MLAFSAREPAAQTVPLAPDDRQDENAPRGQLRSLARARHLARLGTAFVQTRVRRAWLRLINLTAGGRRRDSTLLRHGFSSIEISALGCKLDEV
jgi:hypothetical protein